MRKSLRIHSFVIVLFGVDFQASRTHEQSLNIFFGFFAGGMLGSVNFGQNSSKDVQPKVKDWFSADDIVKLFFVAKLLLLIVALITLGTKPFK